MAAFFDNGSMERGMVMQTYRGKSVFGGVAVGKICVYQKGEQTVKRTKIENTEQEKARFNAAVQESIRQLGELYEKAVKEVGEANAAIFEIHQIMLEDEDYLDAVQNIIDTQEVNAEYAVAVTGDNFAQMFAAMEDEYMRGRAADVKDISERIVRVLSGGAGQGIHTDEPVIILADDLAPSETVQLEKDKVLSFVTVHGSVNSHTAILARTMSIPALIGTDVALDETVDGKFAIVDGTNGVLYVEPDEETLETMRRRQREEQEKKELLQTLKGRETVTLDGKKIRLSQPQQMMAQDRKIVDVPKWTFQAFGLHMRKEYAKRNVQSGIDPVGLADIMGMDLFIPTDDTKELGCTPDDIEAAIFDSIALSKASFEGKAKLLEMKGE